MAEIVLDGVTKVYPNGVRAVAPVSLTIDDGEFVVLVGPSGCGKSTLLRMIAGLETISAGRLSMDGAVVNDMPARDRDVAMVFQNYALYPHMTVRDNMGFGLKMRGTPRAQVAERVAEAARMLGLDALLDRKPGQLSGGQRQRVALGRAVVRQPRLFLFDEPLSNLDAKLRGETRAELIRLHRRLRATCIYVTHDQTEAMSMGDRVVVLRDGVVQQQGAPLEIYREPANEFVAGFLGSPPMNLLAAEVTQSTSERIDLRGDGFAITTDGAIAERARLRIEAGIARVTLGVRPEHFREVLDDASLHGASDVKRADDVVRAEVLFVEPLGSEVLATCKLGSREIVARLAPDTRVAAGSTVNLRIDFAHTRLFDPTTGERV